MILGLGNDLIEVNRIEKAIQREGFLTRYFTEEEINMFTKRHLNPQVVAGNFAAKEAVSKALGTGIRQFGLRDIEVLRDHLGKPYINLYHGAEETAKACGIAKWHVTISHLETMAMALAIGEGNDFKNG